MATGLVRIADAADHICGGGKHRTLAHSTSGPCLQQNLVCILEGRLVSHQPCAIVGIGQTHHKTRRCDVSFGGLVREAGFRALDDAQMTWPTSTRSSLGKAPDLFEGVMKPELYLSDALGATGKPMFRVHTAGSVGGTTGIVAAHHVETGRHKRVLAVAFEKQSEGNAQFALGCGKGASLGAGGAFAPFMRAYIAPQRRAASTSGSKVAVKDRQNALKNPYAHLKIEDISIEKVKDVADDVGPDPLPRVVPVVRRRVRGRVHRRGGRQGGRGRRPSAGVDPRHRGALGAAAASRAATRCARRAPSTAPRTCTSRPASPTRASRSTCAELYVPFSWYEPMWLEAHDIAEPGEGWKMVDAATPRSAARSR